MLSKEWIYEDDLPDDYPYDLMFPLSKVDVVRMFPSLEFVRDLALVGLSVQEGLKDAKEVFAQILLEISEFDLGHDYLRVHEKAAQLIAAFALKQKGEVVAEFDATVEYQPIGASKIIIPWEDGLDEDLRYKDVHVTISLPQQEQDHQGVSTNQEESKS